MIVASLDGFGMRILCGSHLIALTILSRPVLLIEQQQRASADYGETDWRDHRPAWWWSTRMYSTGYQFAWRFRTLEGLACSGTRSQVVQSIILETKGEVSTMVEESKQENVEKEFQRKILDQCVNEGIVWSCLTECSLGKARQEWEEANNPRQHVITSYDNTLYKEIPSLRMALILPSDNCEWWRAGTEFQ